MLILSYGYNPAPTKKEGAGYSIRLPGHHNQRKNMDCLRPLGETPNILRFGFAHFFEVVIGRLLSKYVCIQRCNCKVTKKNTNHLIYFKKNIITTSHLTFQRRIIFNAMTDKISFS